MTRLLLLLLALLTSSAAPLAGQTVALFDTSDAAARRVPAHVVDWGEAGLLSLRAAPDLRAWQAVRYDRNLRRQALTEIPRNVRTPKASENPNELEFLWRIAVGKQYIYLVELFQRSLFVHRLDTAGDILSYEYKPDADVGRYWTCFAAGNGDLLALEQDTTAGSARLHRLTAAELKPQPPLALALPPARAMRSSFIGFARDTFYFGQTQARTKETPPNILVVAAPAGGGRPVTAPMRIPAGMPAFGGKATLALDATRGEVYAWGLYGKADAKAPGGLWLFRRSDGRFFPVFFGQTVKAAQNAGARLDYALNFDENGARLSVVANLGSERRAWAWPVPKDAKPQDLRSPEMAGLATPPAGPPRYLAPFSYQPQARFPASSDDLKAPYSPGEARTSGGKRITYLQTETGIKPAYISAD